MYKRKTKTWMKHYDFVIIDFVAIQISLYCAFLLRHGFEWMYGMDLYRDTAVCLALIDLLVMFFCESHKGILKRGMLNEFKATVRHVTYSTGVLLVYLFFVKEGNNFSRATFFYMWGIAVCLIWTVRCLWKRYIKRKKENHKNALVIVTTYERAAKAVQAMSAKDYENFFLAGICIVDQDVTHERIEGLPVVACGDEILPYIKCHWVDEVLINLLFTEYRETREQIIKGCTRMGLTIHQAILEHQAVDAGNQVIQNVGDYMVVSSSINITTTRQLFIKRVMDIAGGLVGTVCAGIIALVIGPIIYYHSPGPIIFSQERIGKNGKKFKMYKFRSMYMDAEQRKKELLEQNEVKDGMMFKMENDPRIIHGKNGKPGIGHFIRNTSLDEFPQFFNVLKGDMSLIGTRPPTVDEWEKYDLHHRARMSIKPGITGMWQVSGRSDIKDFEEVVALDTKYIRNWSLSMDLKILFQTVGVVLRREGSR